MLNEILLSIILPIYKVEQFLPKCINTILGQSLADYEILLVDDGSPDSCPEICDSYAEKYNDRIRVIHKINGGLSDARNAGILEAKGRYIWFVDSDDYISENALETVVPHLKSADLDILLFNYQEVSLDKKKQVLKFKNENLISASDLVQKYSSIGIQAWTQIYSADFIKSNNLEFLKGSLYEDVIFNVQAYLLNPKIRVIEEVLYNYIQRPGSIMNEKITLKNLQSLVNILDIYTSDVVQQYYPKNYVAGRLHYYFLCIFNFLHRSNLTEKERGDFLNLVKQKKYFFVEREEDTLISKNIKNVFFMKRPNLVYRNWWLFFKLIRFENLLNKGRHE